MSKYEKGFLFFDKKWFFDNEFYRSLSHAEFRIMTYLLSSTLRVTKRDPRFKNGELFARLYQDNNLLTVNVSQETISKSCNVNRGTAKKSVDKFDQYGAVIKLSAKEDGIVNNFYIVGFEIEVHGEKQILYLVNSRFLSRGAPIPDKIINYIRRKYKDGGKIYLEKSKENNRSMIDILFGIKGEVDVPYPLGV